MPILHQKNKIPACFALIVMAGEMLTYLHTPCMEFVLQFCNFSITIFRYYSFHGCFPNSYFHKSGKEHDPGGRNGVCAGALTLRAAGAAQCGGDGGGWGNAGLGNTQGMKGLFGSEDRFGQDRLLQRGLGSCHWEARVGKCTESSLRGVSVCPAAVTEHTRLIWPIHGPVSRDVPVCPGGSHDKAEPSRGGF